MNEVKIIKQVLPVIEFNYEEIKVELEKNLEQYKNVIVTSETLKDCSVIKKGLTKLKKQLSDRRISIKKEVSIPITIFETQIKELSKMIEDVELPIKKGLDFFEVERKEKRKAEVEKLIDDLVSSNEFGILISDVEIKETYLNKSITMKKVKVLIQEDINRLNDLEKLREANISTITTMLKVLNQQLPEEHHLSLKLYINMLDNHDISYIIESANEELLKAKERIKRAEETEKITVDRLHAEREEVIKVESEQKVTLEITATVTQFKELIVYMNNNGIGYEKL